MKLRDELIRAANANPEIRKWAVPMLRASRVAAMSESTLWGHLRRVRWPKMEAEYLKTSWMFMWQPKMSAMALGVFKSLKSSLLMSLQGDVYPKGSSTPLKGQKLEVLVTHIIGLGKAAYEQAMSDPSYAAKIASRPVKDFEAAFPRPVDFKAINTSSFKATAKEHIRYYQDALSDPATSGFGKEVKWLVQLYGMILEDNTPGFAYGQYRYLLVTRNITKAALASSAEVQPGNPVFDENIARDFMAEVQSFTGYNKKRMK